ncbi:hypothetical protein ACGF07_03070 [Kitasatospora sp. NPDC048194]|uniref:hypothetical protein n=1 Tax=Kitasatospora sp. NPDC048194 TaxID=3364045 RepID=UPI00371DA415
MADETNDDRAQAPMVWALAVREAAQGPPLAELIVEVGDDLYAEFVEAAVDSGFTLAAGEPSVTSGAVEVGEGRVRRLVLVGGREIWEPDTRVEASPGWLAAAEGRGAAVLILVPPRTWPPGLVELGPEERLEVFNRQFDREQRAGRVLHGIVSVRLAGPSDSGWPARGAE